MYQVLARFYDALVKDDKATQDWVDFIEAHASFQRVLEYACGSGEITLALARKGYDVKASDLSSDMIEMAKRKEDAYVIGLLHDICKCWDDEKSERFMKVYEKDHLDEPKAIWHGYLADHYLKRVFKIKEKHILKAVHHHVKGDCDDPYAQIVYIADKCEPLRGYDSSYELNLAKRNLKEAVYYVKQVQSEYIKKEKQV